MSTDPSGQTYQVFQSSAQPGQAGQAGQVWGTGGGGGGGVAWGGGLDDQQRQLVRDALQPQQSELQKLEEQLRDAQKELMKAVLAEHYDEKVCEEKADTVARLQTKIYLLRGKAYSSVSATLKPEQRQYMENFGFFMLQNSWALGGPMNMRMSQPGVPGAPGAGPQRMPGGGTMLPPSAPPAPAATPR